ncbi:MAG: nucleotidyltransferase, partial [Nonomuraea sp.]|nr:nucleotidyltransferase [Nonomuraea sp.]
FWRVEASPGREVGSYELRYDTASNGWLLLRAWD